MFILAYEFSYTFLSALVINKFESNNTKFHKSLYSEMGKLVRSDMWLHVTGPLKLCHDYWTAILPLSHRRGGLGHKAREKLTLIQRTPFHLLPKQAI